MESGFTLLELLVVIIIIGILATLGITHYGGIKEQAIDREAIANLKLMQSAERIYRMEDSNNPAQYYPDPNTGSTWDTANINQNLRLSLSAALNRNWNYGCWSNGCVQAHRNGGDLRNYRARIGEDDPQPGQTCP